MTSYLGLIRLVSLFNIINNTYSYKFPSLIQLLQFRTNSRIVLCPLTSKYHCTLAQAERESHANQCVHFYCNFLSLHCECTSHTSCTSITWPKNLKKCMKPDWNFQTGWASWKKNPSLGEMYIFSGTTNYINACYGLPFATAYKLIHVGRSVNKDW